MEPWIFPLLAFGILISIGAIRIAHEGERRVPDLADYLLVLSRSLYGLRVALNRVFPPFSALEQKVLSTIEMNVRAEYLERYQDHVSRVNLIQRDGGHRRVRMYNWRFPGWYSWTRKELFEPTTGVSKLARFRFQLDDGSQVGGSLVSIDGVICNITFGADVSGVVVAPDFQIHIVGGSICSTAALRG